MPRRIRVILSDDHPLVRAGIRSTCSTEGNIDLVGEARDGNEVRKLCAELQPDVLLLDLNMPGPPAVQTVGYLREHHPELKVIVLTAYDEDAYIRGLVAAGVAGYILKDEVPETVVRAICAVMQGDTWFSRPVIQKLAQLKAAESNGKAAFHLTDQEYAILRLVAMGWDNARIAEALCLAEQSVRNTVSRVYAKIGVSSRAEAIVLARERGVLKE